MLLLLRGKCKEVQIYTCFVLLDALARNFFRIIWDAFPPYSVPSCSDVIILLFMRDNFISAGKINPQTLLKTRVVNWIFS